MIIIIICLKCGAEHHIDFIIKYCLNNDCNAYLGNKKKKDVLKKPEFVLEKSETVKKDDEIVEEKPETVEKDAGGTMLLGKIIKEREV